MGDLNYRIALSYETCKELVAQGKLAELLEKDQLKTTQKTDPIIGKFHEAPIKFNPTFKFNNNADVYDTSAKRRVPSWTDRILVRTSDPRMRIGLEDMVIFETDAIHHYIKDKSIFMTDCNSPMQTKEKNYPKQPHCICYRMIKNSFSDHRPVTAAYYSSVIFHFGVYGDNRIIKACLMQVMEKCEKACKNCELAKTLEEQTGVDKFMRRVMKPYKLRSKKDYGGPVPPSVILNPYGYE